VPKPLVSEVSATLSGESRIVETESMNRQHDIEPYWQDEDDWLCTAEFFPSADLEGRVFAANIVGYLFGYARLANARALALVGDPEARRVRAPFSFSAPGDKDQFMDLVRSNEDMVSDHIENDLMSPTQRKRLGMLVRSWRSCLKTL
jgi:hypothetical protein